jgi:hypothetical protein
MANQFFQKVTKMEKYIFMSASSNIQTPQKYFFFLKGGKCILKGNAKAASENVESLIFSFVNTEARLSHESIRYSKTLFYTILLSAHHILMKTCTRF